MTGGAVNVTVSLTVGVGAVYVLVVLIVGVTSGAGGAPGVRVTVGVIVSDAVTVLVGGVTVCCSVFLTGSGGSLRPEQSATMAGVMANPRNTTANVEQYRTTPTFTAASLTF